ncbi:hypothetical protein H4R19_004237 [Coemansia spiralis]|nr:hypothetical protein H4R19_004237 [Coemansia spiralis]
MDAEHSLLVTDTDDVDVLRERLHDTTAQLQTAARMGLELVAQNQAMQRRLERLEHEHEGLVQRVSLAERDRRWMQEQSLRVDQLRASVAELAAQAEGSRSRRAAGDRRVGSLEHSVDKLRLDVDGLVQALDEDAPSRRWAAEIAALQRGLGEARADIESLTSLAEAAHETRDGREAQRKTRHADLARQLGDLAAQAAARDSAQDEMHARLGALCGGVVSLDELLHSVVAEYQATLTDHEQAIRTLTDAQSQLAEEQRWAAIHASRPCSPLPPLPQTAGNRQRSRPNGALTTSQPARGRGGGGGVQRAAARRESTVQAGRREHMGGECLDSILADIPAAGSAGGLPPLPPPSPPVSISGGSGPAHPAWPPAGTQPRKAASVVASSRRRASRPRISSFSQLHSQPPAIVAGFSVISTQSHVGVGWGNYWNSRRRHTNFGLHQRLNITMAHGELLHAQSAPSTARPLGLGDLAAAD